MNQSAASVSLIGSLASNQTHINNVSISSLGNHTDLITPVIPVIPVLGIVFPLLTIIPIFIGLGFSFYRYHQRMKRLMYRKGIVPPNERPRIKAPSAAMNWEMEFSTLFEEAGERNKDDDSGKDKNTGSASKKYEVENENSRPAQAKNGSRNNSPEVHYDTNVTTGHFWAAPRKMSADFEIMPVVLNRDVKFNSKQDDKSKRKLIDLTI